MIGLFTTLRVRDGRAWFWEDHLRRLGEAPPDLAARVAAAVAGLADARVRVTLSGDGTCQVQAWPYAPPGRAWTLRPVPVSPPADGPLLKTTDRSYYDAARGAAGECDEAVLVAPSGSWLECTTANIFLRMPDGRLLTPRGDLPLLPGIARKRVLEASPRLGLQPEEARVDAETARAAVECIVTNALFIAHSVRAIEGVTTFDGGGLARRLLQIVPRRDLPTRIIPS